MKIFGFSVMTLFLFAVFYWLGTKFPNSLSKLPLVG